ncbi:TorD/DmsD family molecular chaperone [Desulfitobacterium sp. AusDCA]|uniref:TorD/DmsD family molecular chaperone n=1 Tax=Desulfitobacterium sp. AusDCA TaxID=3240383 RepID=UPI003DA79851
MGQSAELKSLEQLRSTIGFLLGLSQFFAKGGEELAQTLDPLSHAISSFAETHELNHLLVDGQNIARFTKYDFSEFESMKYEFNRLFVGPASSKAPPYESVYFSPDRLVMQEQTLAVRKMYNREQLASSGQGHEPDDFIGTELEFMAYLLSRAMRAMQHDKLAQSSYYFDLYEEFCNKHTRLWWKLFAQAINQATTHPVFLAVSRALLSVNQLNFKL